MVGSAIVSGFGVLLALLELRHWFEMDTLLGKLLEAILPLLLAGTLIYAGYWLAHSRFDARHVERIVGWFAVGTVSLVLVTGWVIGHQLIRGLPFAHTPFVMTNVLVVGGIGGFVIGIYDARSKLRKEELAAEQERMAFLNRLLRHNVLNDMNLVLGRATTLEEHVDTDGQPAVDLVVERSEDIVELVTKMRWLTRVITTEGEFERKTIELSTNLERELEKIQDSYNVTIRADVPSGLYVEADDLLAELFENLLTNAVHHNDITDPRVTVWVDDRPDSFVVNIADNGPGIPDGEKDDLFELDQGNITSDGGGIGLVLVETLVSQYGGDIWVEDNEPRGALFRVELPSAEDSVTTADEPTTHENRQRQSRTLAARE